MRTKTLVLAAALSVAGLATSMAQSNVYSLNVVGYINVPLVNGNSGGTFNLIANQLDFDGTGTNNTFNSTLGTNGWAAGTVAYGFNPATGLYESASFSAVTKTWGGNTIAALGLQPGNGIFLKNGNVGTAGPTSVTLVGNVLQGNLVNPINAGYQIVSSIVPQAGLITTDLGLTPAQIGDNSKAYQFNAATQLYTSKTVSAISHNWTAQPTLAVGEAIFLNSTLATSWNRSFTVQ